MSAAHPLRMQRLHAIHRPCCQTMRAAPHLHDKKHAHLQELLLCRVEAAWQRQRPVNRSELPHLRCVSSLHWHKGEGGGAAVRMP